MLIGLSKHSHCFLFLMWCFLKEIENMFSLFPSSYRNTCGSLLELKKAVETLTSPLMFPQHILFSKHLWKFAGTQKSCGNTHQSAHVPTAYLVLQTLVEVCWNSKKLWKHSPVSSCSHSISCSPKLPSLDRNMAHVFCFIVKEPYS